MLTDNALVTILLCSYIGIKDDNYKPYTAIQWSNLVSKIIYSSIKEPAKLLYLSQEEICKNLSINTDESDRIRKLLSRGANIAFKLEEFERKGISIVTRSDNNYPYRLKSLLKKSAPPIIYYSGDISIANYKGIAIVGSRNIDKDGEQFAKNLAKKAAEENLSVISGGARGIDSISENSALNNGGRVISVLADSLFKKLKIKDVRDSINSGKLLLMTANNPDAPFTAGGAMNRNKFIYVLSQGAFVVASDYNKGGTWAGATENIKNDWVNTYVANTNNYSGNIKLIQKGAKAIDNIKDITINDLISNNIKNSEQIDIFDLENCIANEERKELENKNDKPILFNNTSSNKDYYDLYNYVKDIICDCISEPKTLSELCDELKVNKSQASSWLSRAIEDNKVKKISKPVRYVSIYKK